MPATFRYTFDSYTHVSVDQATVIVGTSTVMEKPLAGAPLNIRLDSVCCLYFPVHMSVAKWFTWVAGSVFVYLLSIVAAHVLRAVLEVGVVGLLRAAEVRGGVAATACSLFRALRWEEGGTTLHLRHTLFTRGMHVCRRPRIV